MSDTPISDSTHHNVADLGMLCRRLERELTAANEMFRKLNIHALNLTDRIKRLEEAGDEMEKYIFDQTNTRFIICAIQWREAKEAKP
jgi:hypothetical protein